MQACLSLNQKSSARAIPARAKGGNKEMMQPCLIYRHAISLVSSLSQPKSEVVRSCPHRVRVCGDGMGYGRVHPVSSCPHLVGVADSPERLHGNGRCF